MSEDKQRPNPTTLDPIVKTTDKGAITLTELELSRASGGKLFPVCCSGKHIPEVVLF